MTKADKAIAELLNSPDRQKWEDRFWRRVDSSKQGCWEWTSCLTERGYGHLLLPLGSKWASVRANRLAWALHNNQPIPKELVVCHRCDNTRCANPAHLFIGHQRDNVEDMMAKGRGRQGEHWIRIPAETVEAIRSGEGTPQELSLKYGVSLNHTYNILAGRRRAAA